jgi:radical SAM-linked protein
MTWVLVTFARDGAARYLSHLDTARALQRTFARAQVLLALSRGMRPKPRLSLGLPLPVGAAALSELAIAELAEEQDLRPELLLTRLRAAAPEGITPLAVTEVPERVRLEPRAAVYECCTGLPAAAARAAAAALAAADTVTLDRVTPKGSRTLDLKRYVSRVGVVDDAEAADARVRFTVRHRADGAARPEEVVEVLGRLAGMRSEPGARDLVRLQVEYDGWPNTAGRESEKK